MVRQLEIDFCCGEKVILDHLVPAASENTQGSSTLTLSFSSKFLCVSCSINWFQNTSTGKISHGLHELQADR